MKNSSNKSLATPRTAAGRELLYECLAVNDFLTVPAEDDEYIEVKPGRRSPLYLSVKALWKRPDLMKKIDEHLLSRNSERSWGVVVGIAFGGIPQAIALARDLEVPLVLWDGARPGGGRFVGQVPLGTESALVVEDVIANGSSAAPALAELRKFVATLRLTAIFTYGLDEIIAKARSVDVTTLYPVTGVIDLLATESREGLITRCAEFQSRLAAEIADETGW